MRTKWGTSFRRVYEATVLYSFVCLRTSWVTVPQTHCISHCCMGVSGLTLGNRCQICRDILWLPSVPVTFAGQDWDSQKYELIGRSNFHDLLEMVQGLGIILDFYNHEHGCAFKSREKLSINLLKSAEIMVAVCVFPGLTLACSTLPDPSNSSLGPLRG